MTRVRMTAALLTAVVVALLAASCSADDPISSGGSISGDLAAIYETPSDEQPPDEQPSDEQPPDETAPGSGGEQPPTDGDDTAEAGDDTDGTPCAYEPDPDPAPLPADPAVCIGTLDNGLTYYLRYNDKPGGSLSLHLLVKAGSINEPEAVPGIAHFLEHMLFNGTEAYPGNSLGSTLRDLGVEFGPDLNAYTSYDETAFELTVSTDRPENLSIVFGVLAQMAHAATLDADDIEAERGVVLDEFRRTETSYGHVSSEFDRIYTQGTPYEGHDPIGAAASIESMTAGDLTAFYEAWYVPSNMAVVAVGDWPVDELEALVGEHFGPIPAGRAPPFAPVEVTPNPEASTHVVTDEGQGFSYISLDIPILPADTGTVGGERLRTMEQLIEVMLLNRLDESYYRGELRQVDPPKFLTFAINRALRYYGTNWQGGDLDAASTDYLSVLLTAQEHGFTENDAARAAKQLATALQFELDSAGTTQDGQYAQLYASHFLGGADIGTVEDRYDRISALLAELTAEELTEHYRWLMERAGPVVIAVGPDAASLPSTDDLDAAIAAAAPGEPPPDEPDVEQLMPTPRPVNPVATGPLAVLDGREWEFANGVRVMFVESDIAEGTVNLEAQSLGGWSQLEPGGRALSRTAVDAVLDSGLQDLTRSQINRFLEESTASVNAFIGETTEGFSGGAGTNDVETLFQLLYLLVTAPHVDEPAFLQAANEAEVRTSLAEVNPSWQAWVAYYEARFDEAWHRPVATREQLESITAESLLALYGRRLGDVDDMVVAIVGDIDVSEIERLARHYVGTLPAGGPDTYADRRPAMPDGVVRREVALDEGESAVLEVYHEAEAPVTPLASVAADVLEVALNERLFSVIRERLGATYTPSAGIDSLLAPRPGYASEIYITSDPARLDEVYATMLAILADTATAILAPEEFDQAKAVVATDYGNTSNADLLGVLTDRLLLDDGDLFTPQRRLEELERVGPADVQSLAAALYDKGGRIEIVSSP